MNEGTTKNVQRRYASESDKPLQTRQLTRYQQLLLAHYAAVVVTHRPLPHTQPPTVQSLMHV